MTHSSSGWWISFAKAVLVIVTLFGFVIGEFCVFGWPQPSPVDPVGDSSDPTWQTANCANQELTQRGNSAHLIASVRFASCEVGPFAGQNNTRYYVFVRRAGKPESEEDLILSYFPWDNGSYSSPPVVSWSSRTVLKIVARGVAEVKQQRGSVNGVTASYDLQIVGCGWLFHCDG